jgi:hypothetical protein
MNRVTTNREAGHLKSDKAPETHLGWPPHATQFGTLDIGAPVHERIIGSKPLTSR